MPLEEELSGGSQPAGGLPSPHRRLQLRDEAAGRGQRRDGAAVPPSHASSSSSSSSWPQRPWDIVSRYTQTDSLEHGALPTCRLATREDTVSLPALPPVPRQAAVPWHAPASWAPAAASASCKLPALPAAPPAPARGRETASGATGRGHQRLVLAAQDVSGMVVWVKSWSRAAPGSRSTHRLALQVTSPGSRAGGQQQGWARSSLAGLGTSSTQQSRTGCGSRAPTAPFVPHPPRRGGTGRAAASWRPAAQQQLLRMVVPDNRSRNSSSLRVHHQPRSTVTMELLERGARSCPARGGHRLLELRVSLQRRQQDRSEQSGLWQQERKQEQTPMEGLKDMTEEETPREGPQDTSREDTEDLQGAITDDALQQLEARRVPSKQQAEAAGWPVQAALEHEGAKPRALAQEEQERGELSSKELSQDPDTDVTNIWVNPLFPQLMQDPLTQSTSPPPDSPSDAEAAASAVPGALQEEPLAPTAPEEDESATASRSAAPASGSDELLLDSTQFLVQKVGSRALLVTQQQDDPAQSSSSRSHVPDSDPGSTPRGARSRQGLLWRMAKALRRALNALQHLSRDYVPSPHCPPPHPPGAAPADASVPSGRHCLTSHPSAGDNKANSSHHGPQGSSPEEAGSRQGAGEPLRAAGLGAHSGAHRCPRAALGHSGSLAACAAAASQPPARASGQALGTFPF